MKNFFVLFLFFIKFFTCLYSMDTILMDKVLINLKENRTKIKNMKFNFIQEIENNFEDEKYPKIIGEIYFKTPYKFKISYDNNKFLYLFNGEKLFFYDKIKNQVIEKDNNENDFLGIEVINFFFLDDDIIKNFDISSFWIDDKKNYNFSFLDRRNKDKIFLTVNEKFFPEKITWDKEFTKIFIFISSIKCNTNNIKDTDFEIENYTSNKKNVNFLKI